MAETRVFTRIIDCLKFKQKTAFSYAAEGLAARIEREVHTLWLFYGGICLNFDLLYINWYIILQNQLDFEQAVFEKSCRVFSQFSACFTMILSPRHAVFAVPAECSVRPKSKQFFHALVVPWRPAVHGGQACLRLEETHDP